MKTPFYRHTNAPEHRMEIIEEKDGVAIFEDLSGPYPSRVKCPLTADFVIPEADRGAIVRGEDPMDCWPIEDRARAYESMMAGAGESSWPFHIMGGRSI